MPGPKTESANVWIILDSTNRHISPNSSLCTHIFSVPSVAKVS